MPNSFDHFEFLQQCIAKGESGINEWNEWRKNEPNIQPHFSGNNGENSRYLAGAKLTGINLSNAIFAYAFMLSETQLDGANLDGVTIQGAIGLGINFSGANIRNAKLNGSRFDGSDFSNTDLSGTNFQEARLTGVRFNGAIFDKNNFENNNLTRADFNSVNLTGTNFRQSILVEADFTNAIISECEVYGISAWNVITNGAIQKDLVVTNYNEPTITADSIEVAQFIHLLLNNPKIRDVIDTVASKAVLILGRFSKNKPALFAIKEELRNLGYVPILFDFDKPKSQKLTETTVTLANLVRFIIADISNPTSVIQELAALKCSFFKKPVQIIFMPTIEEPRPWAMYEDFDDNFLPKYNYESIENLINTLHDKVISPAEHYLASN